MSFEDLLIVEKDALVPTFLLQSAQWEANELQLEIENGQRPSLALDCPSLSDWAPKKDTDRIESLCVYTLMNSEKLITSKMAPFRFSVEFEDLSFLIQHVDQRLFSDPILYAGSKWQVHLRRVNSGGSHRLGLYIQRLPMSVADLKSKQTTSPASNGTLLTPSTGFVDDREAIMMWVQFYATVANEYYKIETKPFTFKRGQCRGWNYSKVSFD